MAETAIFMTIYDPVVAACAIRVGAVPVSPDAHFRDVPGLKIISRPPGGR